MSRIAKNPVVLPEKVDVTVGAAEVTVKGPLGTLKQSIAPTVTSTFSGTTTGFLAMRDIVSFLYTTMQSTSPPMPVSRALRSVITPREVETMATPSPFMTCGMSSRPL